MGERLRIAFHLVKRFLTSLSPRPPEPAQETWARGSLTDGEQAIWDRMSNPDRRHAIEVASDVMARWPDDPASGGSVEPGRAVVAAALLHDCGKVESGLGTFGRVGATLFWAVADTGRADVWLQAETGGIRGHLARYRRHPELGAALLAAAGSDQLTSAWAAEHHRPMSAWTVDPAVGTLLKACDDD
jgi:hypothetical protein